MMAGCVGWLMGRWLRDEVDGREDAHGWMGGRKKGGGLMEGQVDARPANGQTDEGMDVWLDTCR